MALADKTLLISASYIRQKTPLNDTLDDAYLTPAILLAQDKHAQDYLGTNLYEAILTKVNDGSISDAGNAAYKALLDDFVRPMVVWWTLVEMHPYLISKVDNGGYVVRTSQDTTIAPNASEILNSWKRSAEHYTDRLYRYLCQYGSTFDEWSAAIDDGIHPSRRRPNSVSFIVGGQPISKSEEIFRIMTRDV